MRIISGVNRSRVLETLPGDNTRPTSDKVRGAIFSALQNKVYDAKFLDIFGGSGAMSLEALSRGAELAVSNDMNLAAYQIINKNKQSLKATNLEVYNLGYDVLLKELANKKYVFDIVFLDPPYHLDCYEEIISLLQTYQLVNERTMIICESSIEVKLKETIGEFVIKKVKKYGKSNVTYFIKE